MTRVPFVEKLIVRVEQLVPGEAPGPTMPGSVRYRTLDGASLCARHAQELRDYLPGEEFRRVLTDDEIEVCVMELGFRREDIMQLHGMRYFDECVMCNVPENLAAKCGNCGRAMHPQWPSVYCTTDCALEDA